MISILQVIEIFCLFCNNYIPPVSCYSVLIDYQSKGFVKDARTYTPSIYNWFPTRIFYTGYSDECEILASVLLVVLRKLRENKFSLYKNKFDLCLTNGPLFITQAAGESPKFANHVYAGTELVCFATLNYPRAIPLRQLFKNVYECLNLLYCLF